MLAMLLVIFICVANAILGFVLAIHFGHGPPWSHYPRLDKLRQKIRAILRMDRQAHS